MINLKLWGLRRTGTNWHAHNIERTWPGLVRVWHDAEDGTAWKHGPPEIRDVWDGHIICHREYTDWIAAMRRYWSERPVEMRPTLRELIERRQEMTARYDRFMRACDALGVPYVSVVLDHDHAAERAFLRSVQRVFGLSLPSWFMIEPNRMRKCGDATPIADRTHPEPFVPAQPAGAYGLRAEPPAQVR